MIKKKLVIICTAMLIFLLGYSANRLYSAIDKMHSTKQKYNTYGALSFHNDKILYTSCWGDIYKTDYCRLVSHDPFTKESKIIHTTGDFQGSPIYSWDGKRIVYANVIPERNASNICVMDADGGNHRQLTHDYADDANIIDTPKGKITKVKFNSMPSFSRDGKRIIFTRASLKRQRMRHYGDIYTLWDIFEINLETNAIKQLTNYKFYEISRPFYLSDDKRFIFWATNPILPGLSTTMQMDFRENYKRQYRYNNIFIMDGIKNDLRPAFTFGRWTSDPSVTKDDAILFISITDDEAYLPPIPGNYDLLLKKGNAITRVARSRGHIADPSISFDGKHILFNVAKHEKGGRFSYKYLINSNGSDLINIAIQSIGPVKESKVIKTVNSKKQVKGKR